MIGAPKDSDKTDLVGQIGKGSAAFETGDFESAIRHFKRSIELNKNNAQLWNDLGQSYRALNQLENAEKCYNRAVGLDASFADPLNNLGALSRLLGNLDSAEQYYTAALLRRPQFPEAHYNLALVMEARGDFISAERCYRDALSHRPDYLYALNNLSVLLVQLGRLESAERLLRRGLSFHGRSAELLTSLGTCLRNRGKLNQATEAYRKAIAIKPGFSEAIWNLALVDLAQGRFKKGWINYLHRPTIDRALIPIPNKILETDLTHRFFHVYGEQGLGDELFFMRFLPILANRGGNFIYEPNALIKDICIRAISDYQVSVMTGEGERLALPDLPYLLNIESPPATLRTRPLEGYLKKARAALTDAGPPPYIGFTYRAGVQQPGSLYKEVPLIEFVNTLSNVDGTLINLQRLPKISESEILEAVLDRSIADFSIFNDDLEAMLALMDLLDDYVGVSNTNMHLRALLSKPARVLVTHPAEYRWMAFGKSPWFPDFRLYRQSQTGSWDRALQILSIDLAKI